MRRRMQAGDLFARSITARANRVKVLSESQIEAALESLPNWRRDGDTILRDFKAESVTEAAALIPRLAAYAETMNHHPEVFWVYDKLTIGFTTHDANGLTALDVRMASYIERWLHD